MTLQTGFYQGYCNMCGTRGRFAGDLRLARDQFACPSCGATLRYREIAAAILTHFADGRDVFLDRFVRSDACQRLSVLEVAKRSPFVRRLQRLPSYTQCYPDGAAAAGGEEAGVVCQDLERLTFHDRSFDLIVSSDVMKHVPDPRRAIAEISRVLKPGGAHIFSIPLRWPIEPSSTVRARLGEDGIEHLHEPVYHRSGSDEPSLVFTDFGADLLEWHREAGLRARFANSHRMVDMLGRFPAVVAVRMT